ncbi:hypothetical protein AeRB84_019596 [Aphanomyces euteiches]|nr:hypothetical protein AeRB84_019596 [Aphanomyces euteiches]
MMKAKSFSSASVPMFDHFKSPRSSVNSTQGGFVTEARNVYEDMTAVFQEWRRRRLARKSSRKNETKGATMPPEENMTRTPKYQALLQSMRARVSSMTYKVDISALDLASRQKQDKKTDSIRSTEYCSQISVPKRTPVTSKLVQPTPVRRHLDLPVKIKEERTVASGATAPVVWPSVPCRKMWRLWFRKDPKTGTGPLRFVASGSVDKKNMASRLNALVMNKLVDIALANSLAASEDAIGDMDDDERFMGVFDAAFEILLHHNPEGNLDTVSADTESIYHGMPTTSVAAEMTAKALTSYRTFQWPDKLWYRVPRGWDFPLLTTCRTMWLYWFRGDAKQRVGPFRSITLSELTNATSKRAKTKVTALMKDILAMAQDVGYLECIIVQLPVAKLLEAFDLAFSKWLRKLPGTLGWNDGTMPCDVACGLMREVSKPSRI